MSLSKLLESHAVWMGNKWEHFLAFKTKDRTKGSQGIPMYRVMKHSTRSKYRGYKIDSVDVTREGYVFKTVAKNLTKSELIGVLKLLGTN